MYSLLRAALNRPAVLLAGAILGGSLAFLVYVALSISDIRDDLPLEVLGRQRALNLILEDLFELHRVIEHGAREPESLRLGTIRGQVMVTRYHLIQIMANRSDASTHAAAEIFAVTNPVLDDLQIWMDQGLYRSAPDSPMVLSVMAWRTLEAPAMIESLLANAHEEASAILEREVSKLERLWPMLLLIMLQILLVGILFMVYAARAHRLTEDMTIAERRLRDAVESIPVALLLYDRDERLIMCNENFRNLYPGSKDNLVEGISFSELSYQAAHSGGIIDAVEDPGRWLARRQAAFRELSGSFEISLSDGRAMEVFERRTAEGGTVTIMTDITERRTREAELLRIGGELREKNIQLDAALENMVVGLAMFDEDCRLIMCNHRYQEIYSLPSDLCQQGTPLRRIMEVSAHNQGLSEDEALERIETRLAIATSRSASEDREHLAGGEVIKRTHRALPGGGSIAVYEDITARATAETTLRAAKEEAELASRSKSEFLANVSHELRTPLNAIIGFSEIIMAQLFGPVEPPQYREYAGDIHASGRHLLSLINDILDLSKIEAGKFEMLEARVDIADAVDTSLRLIRERAKNGKVELVNDLPDTLPELVADRRAVKQILINLLSNAVKFTEAGGTVTVGAVLRPDGTLEISVEDTGIGMDNADIALAMTPFGQAESALNRRFEGTGLGLPLAERLIALHGGTLDLHSERGVGTRVSVRFPAVRVLSDRVRARRLQDRDGQGYQDDVG